MNTTENNNTNTRQPDFKVFEVLEYDDNGKTETKWIDLGAVWQGGDKGYLIGNIVIPPNSSARKVKILLQPQS